jgi:hypothetical protein
VDAAVPYPGASELVDFLDERFKKYPLWLCPLRQTTRALHSSLIHGLTAQRYSPDHPLDEPEMMLSLGVWGPGPGKYQEFVQFNRDLERQIWPLGGQKWLYSRTYYTESEFWSIYCQGTFDTLRQKYHASHLPTLYDKVKAKPVDNQAFGRFAKIFDTWPICGLYGLLYTFAAKEHLLGDSKARGVRLLKIMASLIIAGAVAAVIMVY